MNTVASDARDTGSGLKTKWLYRPGAAGSLTQLRSRTWVVLKTVARPYTPLRFGAGVVLNSRPPRAYKTTSFLNHSRIAMDLCATAGLPNSITSPDIKDPA